VIWKIIIISYLITYLKHLRCNHHLICVCSSLHFASADSLPPGDIDWMMFCKNDFLPGDGVRLLFFSADILLASLGLSSSSLTDLDFAGGESGASSKCTSWIDSSWRLNLSALGTPLGGCDGVLSWFSCSAAGKVPDGGCCGWNNRSLLWDLSCLNGEWVDLSFNGLQPSWLSYFCW